MIGGVDKPSSGKITINGTNIYELSEPKQAEFRRKEVALIYQFYNLIPVLNVEENICLPLKLDKQTIDENKLSELIKKLGLENKRKNLPNELSRSDNNNVLQSEEVCFNHLQFYLQTNLLGNLDSQNSKEIIDLLKKSNKDYNQTIILVTHDNEIAKQADRIITINDGKII